MNGGRERELAGALADAVTDPDPARAALVMARIARLTGPGWLRLDVSARRVVAASMCRDGRIREGAATVLATAPRPVAAAALAVRVAD